MVVFVGASSCMNSQKTKTASWIRGVSAVCEKKTKTKEKKKMETYNARLDFLACFYQIPSSHIQHFYVYYTTITALNGKGMSN